MGKFFRCTHLMILGLLCFLQYLIPVQAIYESQAGTFDWHQSWLGKTRLSALQGVSQLIVATERNVLASLDVASGAITWRQVLSDSIDKMKITDQGILTVCDDTTTVRFWDSHTGYLVWERDLEESQMFTEFSPVVWENGDVAVVGHGGVIKLSAAGDEIWSWKRPDVSSLDIVGLQRVDNQLYVIDEPDQEATKQVFHVTVLDNATGDIVKTLKVSCHKPSDVSFVNNYMLWKQNESLHWNILGTNKVHTIAVKKLVDSIPSFKGALLDTFELTTLDQDPHLNLFIVTADVEVAEDTFATVTAVLKLSTDAKSFSLVHDQGVQEAFGAAAVSDATLVLVGKSSSTELSATVMSLGGQVRRQVTIPHDVSLTGDIVITNLINTSPIHLYVVTASGSAFMFNDTAVMWSREEALGHITATEFLDLPEKQLWTQMSDELDESKEEQANVHPLTRYIRRLSTHVMELQQLPKWVIHHFTDMVASNTLTGLGRLDSTQSMLRTQACWMNTSATSEVLYRDNFGMRKLLISVTDTGKIIAQDSARKGAIVWTRYFADVEFEEIHVVRSTTVKLPPVVVAIGRSVDGGYQTTHFYRMNGFTGQDYYSQIPEAEMFFEPQISTEISVSKVMPLPIEDPEERTHLLAIFEAGTSRVYIYPDTAGAREAFSRFRPNFYFMHQAHDGSFRGYQVNEGYRGSLTASPMWTLTLPQNEAIVASGKQPSNEKVASLGRVLGNRNVLYKYLNPNMFTLVSTIEEEEKMLIRIIDSVKGTILYETVHDKVDASTNPVHIVQAENWVIYHFWSNDNRFKGYQAVVLELFEGEHENERVATVNFSSFDNMKPSVRSAAFAFPYAVQSVGVTTTRNGVSTREILFALTSNQIMGVNKRLLDPRRPLDKPSKDDQEEALIPYAPIPDERRAFLSYNLEVAGIRHISTTPAMLESTSLVFAYGLDTFFTRSSPSRQFDVLSEDFSKSQLLLTMVGLVAGIVIVGPIVRRKNVNQLWK